MDLIHKAAFCTQIEPVFHTTITVATVSYTCSHSHPVGGRLTAICAEMPPNILSQSFDAQRQAQMERDLNRQPNRHIGDKSDISDRWTLSFTQAPILIIVPQSVFTRGLVYSLYIPSQGGTKYLEEDRGKSCDFTLVTSAECKTA